MSVERASRGTWLGVATLLVTAALWSLNGPLIKTLNAEGGGVSAMAIAFYRSFVGAAVFAGFAWRNRRSAGRVSWKWRIASPIAFTLMTAAFVIATTQTAAANAIILQYSAPIWVALLSPSLLNERAERAETVALSVSMIGVAVIFFGNPVSDRFALTLALASGFGYAVVLVTLRGLREAHPTVVVFWNCFGSAALLAPAVAMGDGFGLTRVQLALILGMGILQFAVPYLLYSWASRHVEAHRASLIVLVETICNPLLTYWIVGETIPTPTLLGGPIILAGVAGAVVLSRCAAR